MLAAAPETMALQDTDEWWRQRRFLARKLLDQSKFEGPYQVVRDAALPASGHYRADFHFMCGWIALRYRNDPASENETRPLIPNAVYWQLLRAVFRPLPRWVVTNTGAPLPRLHRRWCRSDGTAGTGPIFKRRLRSRAKRSKTR